MPTGEKYRLSLIRSTLRSRLGLGRSSKASVGLRACLPFFRLGCPDAAEHRKICEHPVFQPVQNSPQSAESKVRQRDAPPYWVPDQ